MRIDNVIKELQAVRHQEQCAAEARRRADATSPVLRIDREGHPTENIHSILIARIIPTEYGDSRGDVLIDVLRPLSIAEASHLVRWLLDLGIEPTRSEGKAEA